VSVRVNLLPQASKAGARANRQRGIAGLLGVLLLLILGGLYWWQAGRVNDAQDRLAQEELVAQGLQNEVNALAEYRTLEEEQREATESLQLALADEVSVAAVLQDFGAGLPEDAQLDTLALDFQAETIDPVSGRTTVGTFTATGQSLARHAPGVERLLLSLDRFAALYDVHVSDSSLEDREDLDDGVVTFGIDGRIGEEVATDRYADGVPEGLR
jgi:hypothetical protein